MMTTLEQKRARLETARKNLEAFVARGGNLATREAIPVGLEFVEAFAGVAKEFGYDILKPVKKPVDFIRPDPASNR
jgi:hypothetical protein